MIALRPYQQTCVDKTLEYLRSSVEPCVIDAAPAAGKSFMIAETSDKLYSISGGKRILNLAPSAELVVQNYDKMLMTGHPASIFSASAGQKSTRHNIVFGTPGTVKRSISRFVNGYCAVNIDECHGITPTIKSIIAAMAAAMGLPNVAPAMRIAPDMPDDSFAAMLAYSLNRLRICLPVFILLPHQ